MKVHLNQITMFHDTGKGAVDEKITNYVDMGKDLQKFDSFCNKFICDIITYILHNHIGGKGLSQKLMLIWGRGCLETP